MSHRARRACRLSDDPRLGAAAAVLVLIAALAPGGLVPLALIAAPVLAGTLAIVLAGAALDRPSRPRRRAVRSRTVPG